MQIIKWIFFYSALLLVSCNSIGNQLDRIVGEDYYVMYDYDEIKQYDDLARFLFHNPNNYTDILLDYPNINVEGVFFHNKFLLEKYSNFELEICRLDICKTMNNNELISYYGGSIVYEVIGTPIKYEFSMKQLKNHEHIAIGLYVKEVNDCKYWKWQFYE